TPSPIEEEVSVTGASVGAVRWISELAPQAEVLRLKAGGTRVAVLDHFGTLSVFDLVSGKLVWDRAVNLDAATPPLNLQRSSEATAGEIPIPGSSVAERSPLAAAAAPDLIMDRSTIYLAEEDRLIALSASDGSVAWIANFEGETAPAESSWASGALARSKLAINEKAVFLYRPEVGEVHGFSREDGRELWRVSLSRIEKGANEAVALDLNSGIAADEGQVLVYGPEVALLDSDTGAFQWDFDLPETGWAPVKLRQVREVESMQESDSWFVGPPRMIASVDRPGRLIESTLAGAARNRSVGSYFEADTAVVGPAVFWSGERQKQPVMGRLGDGYLWLVGGDRVHRVSKRVPIGGQSHTARGTFVGQAGDHAWFIDGDELQHINFRIGRTIRLPLGALGDAQDLAAVLQGEQLLVTGSKGYATLHARTGVVAQRGSWPARVTDFLTRRGVSRDSRVDTIDRLPQGRLETRFGVPRCRVDHTTLTDDAVLVVFDNRVITAFSSTLPETAAAP
ncbi:MAG: PQQ-binding-like beta-propeller repeat protein, partial [Verrucomicrobiota bacterium]